MHFELSLLKVWIAFWIVNTHTPSFNEISSEITEIIYYKLSVCITTTTTTLRLQQYLGFSPKKKPSQKLVMSGFNWNALHFWKLLPQAAKRHSKTLTLRTSDRSVNYLSKFKTITKLTLRIP